MKVLLTGGGGFIGRNLAEGLSSQYAVKAPSSSELNLLDEVRVRDYLRASNFDVIVHSATVRHNRKLTGPADLLDRNCRMFFNLARNQDCFGRMFYFGSGAEYDRRTMPPMVSEEQFDASVPVDAYGFSKYICARYAEQSDKIFDLRLFGVYGKYEAWDVRFISNACCRVIHGLPIVMRQNVRFDYLHADDLISIMSWFIEHEPRKRAYNVCSGRVTDLASLAEIVAQVSGRNPEIFITQPGMGREYSGNNQRLLAEIGGYQFREFEATIAELYGWYEKHRQAIDPAELEFDGRARAMGTQSGGN